MSHDTTDDHRKEEDMIFALTADERDALQRGLDELADTMPPRVVWDRIREQAAAEGLIHTRGRYSTWYASAGIAAALVLAVMLVPRVEQTLPDIYVTPDPNTEVTGPPVTVLQSLMVESAQLEDNLRSLPDGPRVVRAGTQATILELEDRIAAIDYQLSDPDVQLTPEETEIFWRERVRLMKSLVGLRYAQAQRTTF